MSRVSGYRGSWKPNKRPFVTLTPDAYVAIQGETQVIGCGTCRREVDINRYITGVSTEGTVDSPPGSATINMSIPDNQINQFYVNDGFILSTMMEIEIYAKGYFTIGGFPQYYRIFWGLISGISTSWSNGSTTVSIQCRDILRWWDLTQTIVNPAFTDIGKSASGYNLWGNKFAGANPYTVILMLARESMGDFPLSDGSFMSFLPGNNPTTGPLGIISQGIMEYWQVKFSSIWNRLVLYGTSGQAYTFQGTAGTTNPYQIANRIFEEEARLLNLNRQTEEFKLQPHEIAAFKKELSRAGDVDFFQNEFQSKLSLALTARDQAGGYELYCDTTGDIIFKPPFYNMNVMPNKPTSWIQDFEIIDDSINDTEAEVFTHITSSGNAFGGVMDWGLNDEITTPRTGVVDFHLLKRYGWRRLNLQLEWAGNPRKLFYHLLDHMDKINSRRVSGSITIPMRPEIRMGFPVWIPKHDSFFYIQGISHQYSPGGQATTTLTLTAKRSKFIAPKNIGMMKTNPAPPGAGKDERTYDIKFPSDYGETNGSVYDSSKQVDSQAKGRTEFGAPAIIRDPETGKILGFPNAVMVYRTTIDGLSMTRLLTGVGSTTADNPQPDGKVENNKGTRADKQNEVITTINSEKKSEIIDRLRARRYETGMTSAGVYDYAHDVDNVILEFSVVPATSLNTWKKPKSGQSSATTPEGIEEAKKQLEGAKAELNKLRVELENALKKNKDGRNDAATADINLITTRIERAESDVRVYGASLGIGSKLPDLNVMIRPVSDEFGFEVIGHYRYGRGTFIDRGQVKLLDVETASIANQLNVQFASTGGAITDITDNKTLGPEYTSFAKSFEEMQPDDYRTGASFTGKKYNPNELYENVKVTNEAVYTASINKTLSTKQDGTGIGVYAEADAVRRAVTLAEMKPTLDGMSINGRSTADKCNCGASRYLWLSVLPKEFLSKLFNSPTATQIKEVESEDPGYTEEETKQQGDPIKPTSGGGDLRTRAKEIYTRILRLNAGPDSKGSTEIGRKYMDFLMPAGIENEWRINGQLKDQASCGLAARAYLRELGLRDPELMSPYKTGMAIQDVKDIGLRHGSLNYNKGNPLTGKLNLKEGDILYVNGPGGYQHTVIINEIMEGDPEKSWKVKTTEGGNSIPNRYVEPTDKQLMTARMVLISKGELFPSSQRIREAAQHAMGIASVLRFIQYKKDPLSPKGGWFMGSHPVHWTLDLEKTFDGTTPTDQSQASADAYAVNKSAQEDKNRPKDIPLTEGSGMLTTSGTDFAVDSMKFFDVLYDYLTQQFNQNYTDGNAPRERFAINGNMPIVTPPSFEQDNILQPTNTLFDRAAEGDAYALGAMAENIINSGFGQSEEALKKFEDQFSEGGSVGQAAQNIVDLAGQQFDPSSGNFKPSGLGSISITTSGPSGQWSASTNDILPDGKTAETETEKAIDSGNTQSSKLPNSTLQMIQGKQNANLPKPMQKGQWQPKANPVLRTKINTKPAEYVPIGPILRKTT